MTHPPTSSAGLDRRRTLVVIAAAVLVAVLVIAFAVYRLVADDDPTEAPAPASLESIGAPADVCDPATTTPVAGGSQHVPVGERVTYATAPPASGRHWSAQGLAPAPFGRKFYTAQDRPELEVLVHNLEHGYTILWYDESVADDEERLDQVRAVAAWFRDQGDDFAAKLIAAPWTSADDEERGTFPDGRHVAFSHWSGDELGVLEYCTEPSGAGLAAFMVDHPFSDSPEPGAP